jgi:hypothetical protein
MARFLPARAVLSRAKIDASGLEYLICAPIRAALSADEEAMRPPLFTPQDDIAETHAGGPAT